MVINICPIRLLYWWSPLTKMLQMAALMLNFSCAAALPRQWPGQVSLTAKYLALKEICQSNWGQMLAQFWRRKLCEILHSKFFNYFPFSSLTDWAKKVTHKVAALWRRVQFPSTRIMVQHCQLIEKPFVLDQIFFDYHGMPKRFLPDSLPGRWFLERNFKTLIFLTVWQTFPNLTLLSASFREPVTKSENQIRFEGKSRETEAILDEMILNCDPAIPKFIHS